MTFNVQRAKFCGGVELDLCLPGPAADKYYLLKLRIKV
jgi:hypothetical protein